MQCSGQRTGKDLLKRLVARHVKEEEEKWEKENKRKVKKASNMSSFFSVTERMENS